MEAFWMLKSSKCTWSTNTRNLVNLVTLKQDFLNIWKCIEQGSTSCNDLQIQPKWPKKSIVRDTYIKYVMATKTDIANAFFSFTVPFYLIHCRNELPQF